MPNPFQIENQVLLLISLALLAVKAFALADASVRKSNVFVAADKQNPCGRSCWGSRSSRRC